jgi:hypothetical protein
MAGDDRRHGAVADIQIGVAGGGGNGAKWRA